MPKYDAFISYRHTEPDKSIAEKLHKMLETYRVPSKIAKKIGKKKINRVFRDREELPTSSNLASSIEEALINSEYLIVICSPRTPQSKWVLKEIETFSKLHGHDKILALLVEGEPIESFPEQLRFVSKEIVDENGNIIEEKEEIEPLAADIRGQDTKELVKNLKKELLRLLAPILGCGFDDLRQRHRERLIKRVITISVCFSLFFLSFGSFSTWQAIRIKQQVNKTLEGQSLYLSSLSEQLLNEGDRRTAMLLALEALPKNLENPERPYVEEAEYALSQGLKIYKIDNTFFSDITLDHRKRVTSIQLSPDNSKVFTVCSDGNIYLWDTNNGNLLFTFPHNWPHLFNEKAFFSCNGEIIVSTTSKGVTAWNTTNGTKIWEIEAYAPDIELSPDDKTLLVINQNIKNKDIKLVDAKTGNELLSLPITIENEGDEFIRCSAFNKLGTKLALGTNSGRIWLYDIQNKKELFELKSFNDDVKNIFFSYDDEKIAVFSGMFDLTSNNIFDKGTRNLEIWNIENTKEIINIKLNSSVMAKGSFNPADSNIVIFTENEFANIIDINSGETIYSFAHGDKVTNFKISEDGTVLIVASFDGDILFYDLKTGITADNWNIYHNDLIYSMDMIDNVIAISGYSSNKAYILKAMKNPYITRMPGHSSYIRYGKFSPDGSKALTINDSDIYIWDVENESLFSKLTDIKGTIEEAYFTPDGNKISVLIKEGYIKIYDILSGSESSSINTGSFTRYTYSPSASIVGLQIDDAVKLFDPFECKELLSINNNSYSNQLIFSNKEDLALIINWSDQANLYDVKTGNIIYTFNNDNNVKIKGGAFNEDDSILVLCQDNTLLVFDTKSYERISYIENILFEPSSIHFSYDNRELIVGLDDKSIQIYDLETGKYKTELTGHIQNLKECRYNHDGSLLLTIGEFGDTILWNPENYKKLARIDKVFDVDKDFKTFLSHDGKDAILMPYYHLKSLVDIAKAELGNRELTEEEKLKYYIIE